MGQFVRGPVKLPPLGRPLAPGGSHYKGDCSYKGEPEPTLSLEQSGWTWLAAPPGTVLGVEAPSQCWQ